MKQFFCRTTNVVQLTFLTTVRPSWGSPRPRRPTRAASQWRPSTRPVSPPPPASSSSMTSSLKSPKPPNRHSTSPSKIRFTWMSCALVTCAYVTIIKRNFFLADTFHSSLVSNYSSQVVANKKTLQKIKFRETFCSELFKFQGTISSCSRVTCIILLEGLLVVLLSNYLTSKTDTLTCL